MPESPKKHTFESAISHLEELVEKMEGEDMPLEQLLVSYEEGVALVKVCQQKLAEAEKKIELIQKKSSGEVALRPLDPEGPARDPEGPGHFPESPTRPGGSEKPNSPEDLSLY